MLGVDHQIFKSDLLAEGYSLVNEHPFDSALKRMAVVYGKEGTNMVFMKGATEVVLSCCKYVQRGNERVPMTSEFKPQVEENLQAMSADGLVSNLCASHPRVNLILLSVCCHWGMFPQLLTLLLPAKPLKMRPK